MLVVPHSNALNLIGVTTLIRIKKNNHQIQYPTPQIGMNNTDYSLNRSKLVTIVIKIVVPSLPSQVQEANDHG